MEEIKKRKLETEIKETQYKYPKIDLAEKNLCLGCKIEIPNQLTYCSGQCSDNEALKSKFGIPVWVNSRK